MDTISIEAVADIIGLNKSRIEQWISRGQFFPKVSLAQGKRREWDQGEVIRLAVFVRLVDEVGMTPKVAGHLTQTGVYGFDDDGAFFVCYQTDPTLGWWHDIVRKREIGTFLESGCHIPKVLMSGHSEEVIRYNSENNKGPADVAVIVDLDRLERQIKDRWASLEQ
jgi:predicted DNA-binding transcriptional regulator AlpA